MKYRSEIDGLRAIAVVPVILFHAGFSVFGGGFVGVDIFFVISGYLITTILISEIKSENFSIVNFYERRARRILPALFLVMAVCIPFAWIWLPPEDMKSFGQSIVGVISFSSNIMLWKDSGYFDTSSDLKPLLHTWSLSVEEQFYILFPLFLFFTWKLGKNWVVFILLSLSISSLMAAEYLSTRSPTSAFYLLPSRAWELATGCLIGLYLENRTRIVTHNALQQAMSLIGLLLIIFSILHYSKDTPFPSLYTLVPVFGVALIILFSGPSTFVGRLLSHKILVGIGLVSYSAYLWHQPLFAFSRHVTLGAPSKIILLAIFFCTLLLSYLSFIFIEKPFRRKDFISKKNIFYFSTLFSFIFIGLGVSAHENDGFLSRLSDSAAKTYETSKDISVSTGSPRNPVFIGDPNNIKGALIGDSHAKSIAESLGSSLSNTNIGLRNYIKNGCPPVRGLFRFDIPSYGAKCDEFYSTVYNEISKDNSIKYVVISARFTLYIESNRFDNKEGGKEVGATKEVIYDGIEYKNENRLLVDRKDYISEKFINEIRYLIESGKHVILVYPIPEVGWDVPKAGFKQSKTSIGDIEVSTSFGRFIERNKDTISTLDSIGSHNNLSRVYPHKYLCNSIVEDKCSAIYNSISFYYDSNHLTNLGARLFTDEIARIIKTNSPFSTRF